MYLISCFFIYDISYKHPPSPDYFSRSFPPPPTQITFPDHSPPDHLPSLRSRRNDWGGGGGGANDWGKLIWEENHRG